MEVVERITHNAAGTIVDHYTHWDWEPLCQAVLAVGLRGPAAPAAPSAPPAPAAPPAPVVSPVPAAPAALVAKNVATLAARPVFLEESGWRRRELNPAPRLRWQACAALQE